MQTVKGYVSTNKVCSESYFEFEVDDDATADEIEELAREAMFDNIEWNYIIEESN